MRRLLAALLLLLGALGLGACPAAHNDYPGASCKTDNDCYQGERCMNAAICVPVPATVDMAMTIPPGSDLALSQPTDMTMGEDL